MARLTVILQIAIAVFLGMSATVLVFRATASEPAPVCAQASKR